MRRLALLVAATMAACAAGPVPVAMAEDLPGCGPADVTGGEWRGYGRDLANSRTQSNEKVLGPAEAPLLTPAWTFSTVRNGGGGDLTGTPVVQDGCMYVASSGGWVFAVNADTGKLAWKSKVPYGGRMNASVFVDDGEVTGAGPQDRRSRCATCASRRTFVLRLPRAVRGSPVTSARVYVGRSRRAQVVRGRALRSPVRLRRVPAGRFRVRIVARTADGRTTTLRRTYHTRSAQASGPAGTVYVAVTRLAKAEGCPDGDPCIGPYVAAFDQATGALVWATPPIDTQPGSDVYGSPVVHDGVLLLGVSGGSAELGDEADRYAFQGSMNFLDASTGQVLRKTWTIHPPKQPDDAYAGAGVWSTPAVDPEAKVAYAGTANPFRPQAEHRYANAVVKYDIDRSSARFGEIVGHYKGTIDEYVPGFSQMPCYDFPGNNPPFYPQGIGSCGDIDLDFGASPNLFRDARGRKLVGAGQKSGVYHVFDAETMEPVWTQVVGPPTPVGGIVGSTAHDGTSVYGPVTVPGYVWSLDAAAGRHRWVGPILDGVHWGPPVSVANGVVYSVDLDGFLDAFDARTGTLLNRKPLAFGGGGPVSPSWAGVSVARNTVYAAVGVLGLAEGYVVAYRRGGVTDVVTDITEAGSGGGSGGGGGGPAPPVGPSIVTAPGASAAGYATPVMVTTRGGPLSYTNLDAVQHDVVAEERAPDGQPLFRTPLIGTAQSAPVEGLERVEPGRTYGFFCSLHPNMRGNLAVR